MEPTIPLKACTLCGKSFPNTSEFFKFKRNSKLENQCRDCRATQNAERRKKRIATGLCGACGKNLSAFNRTLCIKCLTVQRERAKAARSKAKAANLCVNCRTRSLVSKALCKICLEKSAVRNQKTAVANAENRRCGDCKGPRDSNRQLCANCAKIRRKQSKARCRILRAQVLNAFGRVCNCCGEPEERFLTLDHVNNDGFKERDKRSTDKIYQRSLLPEYQGEYQILCWNCNMGKAHNNGICPHVRGRTEYLKLCL